MTGFAGRSQFVQHLLKKVAPLSVVSGAFEKTLLPSFFVAHAGLPAEKLGNEILIAVVHDSYNFRYS